MRQLAWLVTGLCALLLCACPKPQKPKTDKEHLLPNLGQQCQVLERVIQRLSGKGSLELLKDWDVSTWTSKKAHFAGMAQELAGGTQYQYSDYSYMSPVRCTVYTTSGGLPAIVECFAEWLGTQEGYSVEQLEEEYMALYKQYPSQQASSPQFMRLPEHYVLEQDGVVVEMARTKPDDAGQRTTVLRLALTPARLAELATTTDTYPKLKEYAKADTPTTLTELCRLLREQGAGGILSRYDFSKFVFDQEQAAPGQAVDYTMQTVYLKSEDGTSLTLECGLLALDGGQRACFAFTPEWYTQSNGFTAEQLDQEFGTLWEASGGEYSAGGDKPESRFRFRCVRSEGVYLTCKELPQQPDQPRRVLYALSVGNVAGEELTKEQTAATAWLKPGVGLPPSSDGALERSLSLLAGTAAMQSVRDQRLLLNERLSKLVSGFNQYPCYFESVYELDPAVDPNQALRMTILDGRWFRLCSFNDEWLRAFGKVKLEQIDSEVARLCDRQQGQRKDSGTKSEPEAIYRFAYGRLKVEAVRRTKEGQPTWAFNIENPF